MPGGLFSRLKVWALNETVKSTDLNGEFNNIIANLNPIEQSGYEASVAQMRIQTSPGSQGAESQATSLSDEIERIRYVVSRMVGLTYWYDNPNTSLQTLNSILSTATITPQNRIQSGRINSDNQPCYLVPDTGSNATVRLKAASTALSVYIKNQSVSIGADLTLPLSGPGAFTLTVNDATMAGAASTKTQGEGVTTLTVATNAGTPPTVGTFQAWKIVDSATTEYFFGQYQSSTAIGKAFRGYFFNQSDASIKRVVVNNSDALTLCRAGYIFLTNVGGVPALSVTYNLPTVSYSQPSGPTSGDWWLDLSTGGIWRTYNGVSFVDGIGVFVGIAVVDGSNVVACRSRDFDRNFSTLDTLILENQDVNTIRSNSLGARVSVYGNNWDYQKNLLLWVKPGNLDSGVSTSTSTAYYLYVSDQGQQVISDQAPHDRRQDLLGYYHPYKPWRCIGTVSTDGSSHYLTPTSFDLVGADRIQANSLTVLQAQIRTQAATVGVGGSAISSSSGAFTSTSTVSTDVTNLSVTITTRGGPVDLELIPDGSVSAAQVGFGTTANEHNNAMSLFWVRDTVNTIATINSQFSYGATGATNILKLDGPGAWKAVDFPPAGTHTYKVQVAGSTSNTTAYCQNVKIWAQEKY